MDCPGPFDEHPAMFTFHLRVRNNVLKWAGRGQVLFRDQPLCLDGKSDEYAHEKDDNELMLMKNRFHRCFFFIAGTGISLMSPPYCTI